MNYGYIFNTTASPTHPSDHIRVGGGEGARLWLSEDMLDGQHEKEYARTAHHGLSQKRLEVHVC